MLRPGERIRGEQRSYLLEEALVGGRHAELWRARCDAGRRWVLKFACRGFTGELRTEWASADERVPGAGWTGRVAAVVDRGVFCRQVFLVQREYDGDLSRWLATAPALPRRLEALRQVAAAVAQLDAGARVHRDLKPANFLVRDDPFEVALTDFGLARRRDDVRGHTGSGTPRLPALGRDAEPGLACRSARRRLRPRGHRLRAPHAAPPPRRKRPRARSPSPGPAAPCAHPPGALGA